MPTGQGPAGGSRLPLPVRDRSLANITKTPASGPSRKRSPPKGTATPSRASSSQPAKHSGSESGPSNPTRTPENNNKQIDDDIYIARQYTAPLPSTTRFSIRTPGNKVIDFRASARLRYSASGRKTQQYPPTQLTPHGRAAIRTLDSRRAAINEIHTPGRNRRRSLRDQRETPRDTLRALGRVLAPQSSAISTSTSSGSSPNYPSGSSNSGSRGRRRRIGDGTGVGGKRSGRKRAAITIPEDPDDDDDEFPIDRPRFSLPIDEDADSDGELPRPPRSSGLEDLDGNVTLQSIELARRATLGSTAPRFSIRTSNFGISDDERGGDMGIDPAFFPQAAWGSGGDDDTGNRADTGMGAGNNVVEEEGDTALQRADDEAARRDTLGGRVSEFGAIDFNVDAVDQSTVVLDPQVQSSPRRESFSPDNEPFGFGDNNDDYDDDEDQRQPFEDDNEMDIGDDAPLGFVESDDEAANLPDDASDLEVDRTAATEDATILSRRPIKSSTIATAATATEARGGRVKRPGKRISRYGIEYPSLPTNVIKRLAQRFAGKTQLSANTLSAIMQASDWFFEQLGDDLRAYANHAKGRTTINETDMLMLMRRWVFHFSFFLLSFDWVS